MVSEIDENTQEEQPTCPEVQKGLLPFELTNDISGDRENGHGKAQCHSGRAREEVGATVTVDG